VPEVAYKDRSAGDLRLRLFSNLVDPALFTVVCQGRALANGMRIDAHILGASHMIRFRAGASCLSEVLVCSDAALQTWPGSCVSHKPASGPLDLELDNVVYQFTGELLRRSAAETLLGNLRACLAAARTRPDEIGLSFEFPAEVRSEKPAETLLWARLGPAGAEIETVHSYPSEDSVVWTQSSAVRTVGARQVTSSTQEVRQPVEIVG
jgi:hypothetical protein